MRKKLLCIKLIHTIIWMFFVLVIFYILFAGIFDKLNIYVFIAIGLIVAASLKKIYHMKMNQMPRMESI